MRITIGDVKATLGVTETYDIVNAIRNSSGNIAQYTPLANATNIAEVGAGILINQQVQNEFISALVDRIGLTVIKKVSLQNPLKKFKKGQLPLGRTIQEVFVDIAKEKAFDPAVAEEEVFKRELPDVSTLYHERNRQGFYKQTIQDESLRTAFVSWGTFDDFVSRIINSIYNGSEVDEFKYMKLVLDNYFAKGLYKFEVVQDPTSSTANATQFIKKVRAVSQKMTLPMGSREFNAMGVHTRTEPEDLHLIIDADLRATVDVDVLASAFNMDKATFLGNVTVIDGFASTGLVAVLVDREFFMVYDQLHKMETIRNPQGLYWSYFYHVWQVLSASRFSNAVAFVLPDSTPDVTQVILQPEIASAKAGSVVQYTSSIRHTDAGPHTPVYTVEGKDGTVKQTGTTIDATGKLTIASNQTGRLVIKSTVTFDTDKKCIGEAVLSVY